MSAERGPPPSKGKPRPLQDVSPTQDKGGVVLLRYDDVRTRIVNLRSTYNDSGTVRFDDMIPVLPPANL